VSQIAWSGDAIQGTILKRVADEQCSEQVVTPAGTLGNQLMTGNDPMQGQINTAMTGTTVDLSANSLSQDGFLNGAGFVDQTVAVGNGSITLPFSKISANASPLRYAVLVCALIGAFLLVSKSVIQGA